jgi:hypothetical protein
VRLWLNPPSKRATPRGLLPIVLFTTPTASGNQKSPTSKEKDWFSKYFSGNLHFKGLNLKSVISSAFMQETCLELLYTNLLQSSGNGGGGAAIYSPPFYFFSSTDFFTPSTNASTASPPPSGTLPPLTKPPLCTFTPNASAMLGKPPSRIAIVRLPRLWWN